MDCNSCLKPRPIPNCIEQLSIGRIAKFNTAVIVRLHNLSTGRIDDIQTTSASDGTVTVDLSDIELMNHAYKITIVEQAAYTTLMDITVSGETGSCIEFLVGQGSDVITELVIAE